MKNVFLALVLAVSSLAVVHAAEARPDRWDRGHHRGGHYHRPPPPRHYGHHHHHRPVLRYPYRTLAWGALLGMLAYHQFQAPPPSMPWACFASSQGYFGNGFGYNPQQAQENALMSCGPACMDGSYEMNCAPRY